MPPASRRQDELRDALATHKLIVDASFLMNHNFPIFAREFADLFARNKLLIPYRVLQEIERIDGLNDERHALTTQALQSIREALQGGLAELRREASDEKTNADQVISRVVEQHIGQHRLLVLTNDRTLRDWVYLKTQAGCFQASRSLLVVRFHPESGQPHIWRNRPPTVSAVDGLSPRRRLPARSGPRATTRPPLPPPFQRASDLAPDLESPLAVTENVDQSRIVYAASKSPVRLTNRLAGGGEGTVYETNRADLVCKVYHNDKLTVGAQKKIELMVTRRLPDPTICWPTEPVYDAAGVFRGFLMPRAAGNPLGHGLFIPKVWLSQRPAWTRRESVKLAINIMEKIDLLHRMGVLLGDINPQNILVQDQNAVCFVDCDSYQVEGFPCPVGSVNFVAPEIQGQDFRRFLRTTEHELFAVATLLFMVVVPGKSPYSHQGGTDGAENIRKMHFPYALGEKKSDNAPEGAWRFCWSHLTRPMKDAFHRCFHADHRGEPRVPVAEWLALFREYDRILSKAHEVFTGPTPQYGFDLSILPQSRRYVQGKGEPLPAGGETDLQRSLQRLMVKVARAAPARAPHPPASRPHVLPAPQSMPAPAPAGGGAQPQQKGGSSCFVATAVFQSERHETVALLRHFRESVLRRSVPGRCFIRVYERVGPVLARVVERCPWSRPVLRASLTFIASRCGKLIPNRAAVRTAANQLGERQ